MWPCRAPGAARSAASPSLRIMIHSLVLTPDKPHNKSCTDTESRTQGVQKESLQLSVSLCAGPLKDDDFSAGAQTQQHQAPRVRQGPAVDRAPLYLCRTTSLFPLVLFSLSLSLSGMRKSPDVSPRRLSDISPQLRQLKYLVVDEAIKEDLKSSRSVEDINSASIEERILRITGYYGYQPWSTSYKSELLSSPSSDRVQRGEKKEKILFNLTHTCCGFRLY